MFFIIGLKRKKRKVLLCGRLYFQTIEYFSFDIQRLKLYRFIHTLYFFSSSESID